MDVYPKNSTTDAKKTVEDAAVFAIGNDIKWTILAAIPKVTDIDKYTIEDELNPKLQFVGAEISLTGTSNVVLEEGDYTLSSAAGAPLEVAFTATGRAKLAKVARRRHCPGEGCHPHQGAGGRRDRQHCHPVPEPA